MYKHRPKHPWQRTLLAFLAAPSGRRRAAYKQRLSGWLSWLIISAQILALASTATAASIQPTPQMAQAAAYELGLGYWLAQRASDLAAWAQPLWGEPKQAAAQTAAPGGVTSGLQLWVKADVGTDTTTDGVGVNTWADQSGNGNDMSVTAAAREPTYSDATENTNFNPAVRFDGLNDGMELAPFMIGTEVGGSVFGAAANNTPGTGFDNLVVFGIDNPHLGTNSGGGGAQLVWMNGSSPINDTHPTLPIAGQTHIWSWEWDMANEPSNTSSNTGVDLIFDGEIFSNTDMELRESSFGNGAPAADQVQIGSYEAVEVWDGPIGEVAIYDRNLTAAESQRVNSYFAIKWGATLDNDPTSGTTNYDYVDSTGATIWPGTADAAYQTYHNGIAGIGRDDNSALIQPKSKSVTSGSVVTMESGGAFAADRSFLVWGHNGSAASYAVSYTPISFTPAAGYFHMGRVWKVDETGTVGTVTVMNDTADHLLVSSVPNFASGVTEIALSGGSATYDFSDGQYFTFGKKLTAPGGVANGLEAWYDAAYGVTISSGTNVSGWADKALNGHDTSQTNVSRQPFFEDATEGINFNPSIHFQPSGTTTQDMLSILEPAAQDNLMFQPTDDGTVIAVGDNSDTASPHSTLIGWGTDANNPQLAVHSGLMQIWNNGSSPVWTVASSNAAAAQDVSNNQPYVFGWNWLNKAGGADRGMDTRLNGFGVTYPDLEGSDIQDFGGATVNNEMHIGWNDCCSEDWTGRISEIAVYTRKLTGAEQQKVDTYFAIKYGISIDPADDDATIEDGDYIDSGDNVIWDYSANTAYHNDVAGIGRDDAADLDQQKSQSVTGKTVTIDSGATLTADKSFLVWGHNGLDASFGVSYSPTTFTPPAGYFHMNRVWKVQETGTVGTVTVMHPSAQHLLVDDDGNFANGGTTEIALSGGSATIDFTSGQYFTFGAPATAPGGVAANLQVWLKANAGVIGSPAVSAWEDQTGNDRHVIEANSSFQPTLQVASPAYNFNPSLSFDGVNDNLAYTGGRFMSTTSSGTLLGAGSNILDSGGYENFADLGIDNPHMGLYDDAGSFSDQIMWMNGSAPVQILHPTKLVANINQLYGYYWNGGGPNAGSGLRLNGEDFYESTTESTLVGNSGVSDGMFSVGSYESVEVWHGNIHEVILYDRNLSAAEKQRVETYLAIKYGTTINPLDDEPSIEDGDYVAADGVTVIWDYSANSTYHNDVAGIGRDDAEALDQRKSKSVNSGTILTIDNGGAFTADGSYLVWGNDDGATTTTETGAPRGMERVTRIWKAAETGTVGVVNISFDISGMGLSAATAQDLVLFIDPIDTDFSDANQIVGSNLAGNVVTFNVDLANGDHFTLGVADRDGDGIPNGTDLDDDNDGILDAQEGDGAVDTDGDGIPDSYDLDSDNDGINDVIEVNGLDADNDGMHDPCGTAEGVGVLNVNISGPTGAIDISNLAAQGTAGFNDFRLWQLRGPNILLFEEQALVLSQPMDIDYLVPANGGNVAGLTGLKIPSGSTVKSYLAHFDSLSGFGNGTASITFDRDIYAINYYFVDLNSSNIMANGSNLWYLGGVRGSTEGDSMTISSDKRTLNFNLNLFGYQDQVRILFADTSGTPPADANGNGIFDCLETAQGGTPLTLVNSDSDSVPDFRDLDSDNDTLSDLLEGGSGSLDADDNGVVDGPDTDGDGIPDSTDGAPTSFGDANSPALPNRDGDADADFRDPDSDGDGTNDIVEAGNGSLDGNNDGEIDNTTDAEGDGIADIIDSDDPNFGGLGVPTAMSTVDTDNDGVPDVQDVDDDNDGILDVIEGTDDADGDGIPNSLDLDSDNDGINDVREGGLIDSNFDEVIDGPDNDGDGMADDPGGDANGNGLPSTVDPGEGGTPATVPDSDNDGIPDFLDLDSDNDSISDLVEGGSGGTDADNNGVIDQTGTNDSDGDGILDSVDGDTGTFGDSGDPTPTNSGGVPFYYDFQDWDSDGNGTDDIIENGQGALDADGNGMIDDTGDADGDGIVDAADSDDVVFGGLAAIVNITVPLKLFLQGAYDPLGGTMRDDLRALANFPLTSPYGDGATTTAPVLAASGADAIVDWVLVEVRDATIASTIVISQSALLQRDGDLVDVDGTATLNITGVTPGNYHVAVHHRNHLGAMTGTPVALSSSTPVVNFTTMNSAATHGDNAQVEVETGVYGLWGGNVNNNNTILRSGAGNDLDPLVNLVLDAPGNTSDNTNYVVNGYSDADVNMDGRVIAAGGGNDINLVLLNVISHPDNGSGSANYTVTEQLP